MSYIEKISIQHSPLDTTRYKSPILRVQQKKAIKKQNSVKNFDPNFWYNPIETGNYLINKNLNKKQNGLIKKKNSTTNYKNFYPKSLKNPNNPTHLKKLNNKSKIIETENNLVDLPFKNKINKIKEKKEFKKPS